MKIETTFVFISYTTPALPIFKLGNAVGILLTTGHIHCCTIKSSYTTAERYMGREKHLPDFISKRHMHAMSQILTIAIILVT